MNRGAVFAVAGAKGGVGKTTTSINLSAVLAGIGHDVVLVELDVAMANVGDFLNLGVRLEHDRDPTLHDVLSGTADVADATYEAPGGFDVVPSGTTLKGFAGADIDATGDVVSEVRTEYDIVVLDTGAGLGMETVLPLSLADETILVSSPRVASVRDTKKTRNLVRHVGGTVAGVVFVKSGSGRSPGVDRIAEFLDVDLLGHVPEDGAVARAQDLGQPVVIAERDSDAAKAYRALGSRVHERVGTLKADLMTTEPGDDGIDADREGEHAALATDEGSGTDGFAFVSGSSEEDGGTDPPGSGDAATETASRNEPRSRNRSDRQEAPVATPTRGEGTGGGTGDGGAAHTGGGDGTSAGRRQTGVQPTSRRASAAPTGDRVGATDDEIASRLASIEEETEDAEPTGSSREQTADDRSASDEMADGDRGADESAADDESWESKQSAAKRFIDRAIGLVDRGD